MRPLQIQPDTGLVLDPQSGLRFKVNTTGALLLKGWQQNRSYKNLVEDLMRECAYNQHQAERAYLTFTRQCRAAGLHPPSLPTHGTPSRTSSDPRNSSAA